MMDVIVALVVFAIIFILITAGNWAFAIVMGLIAVVMFMPTPDGIFYTCIFENVKFLFAKKRYTADAKNPKENIDALVGLKEIKTNGLLAYSGGMYGRVIKVGQKNFGIEDVVQQNIDIGYIANALKLLDANQSVQRTSLTNSPRCARATITATCGRSRGTFCRSASTVSTSSTIFASNICPTIIL